MNVQPLDLDTRPTLLTVAGAATISTIAAVNARGGHVAGMMQDSPHNGRWKLRIEWPEQTLFSKQNVD
jgi:hypothetical protein